MGYLHRPHVLQEIHIERSSLLKHSMYFFCIHTLIVNHTTCTYNTGVSTYPIYENKKKKIKTTTNYNSDKYLQH